MQPEDSQVSPLAWISPPDLGDISAAVPRALDFTMPQLNLSFYPDTPAPPSGHLSQGMSLHPPRWGDLIWYRPGLLLSHCSPGNSATFLNFSPCASIQATVTTACPSRLSPSSVFSVQIPALLCSEHSSWEVGFLGPAQDTSCEHQTRALGSLGRSPARCSRSICCRPWKGQSHPRPPCAPSRVISKSALLMEILLMCGNCSSHFHQASQRVNIN